MTNNLGIVAVSGEALPTAGSVVWWRLSGPLNVEELGAAWERAGLDEALLPNGLTDDAALRKAVDGRKSSTRRVERLPNRSGWAIVEVGGEGDDPTFEVSCRVKLLADGALDISNPDFDSLAEDFRRHREELPSGEVGSWLVRMAQKMNAVHLRPEGGIYFVPRASLDQWRAMAAVLQEVSKHTLYQIPAMRSDEAVRAVLDALTLEAGKAITDMEDDLLQGSVGARGLSNRADHCDRVKEKLSAYDSLLGDGLDVLRGELDKLKARLAAAALLAMGSDDDVEEAA